MPDFIIAGKLDQTASRSVYQVRDFGRNTSGADISKYKKVMYSNINRGQHFIEILFSKNASTNSYQDRGYLLIPKNQ